jgi:hypothetical protein
MLFRRVLQFHLSTALLTASAAGFFLWANVQPFDVVRGTNVFKVRGWPWLFDICIFHSRNATVMVSDYWPSGPLGLRFIDDPVASLGISWTAMLMNLLTCAALLLVIALLLEHWRWVLKVASGRLCSTVAAQRPAPPSTPPSPPPSPPPVRDGG